MCSEEDHDATLCVPQCLLVLERRCVWLSGGAELCVWNIDFQLQCHKQNHSDSGEDQRPAGMEARLSPDARG